MLDVWLWELLEGLGRMLSLPFLYIALVAGLLLSAKRIKKERSMFGARVFDRFSEWKGTWATGLITGFVLSVIAIAGGMVVTYPLLFLIAAILLLVSLTGKLSWYSPAYTLGFTYLLLLILPYLPETFLEYRWVAPLQETPLTVFAVLLSVLLFAEAILLLRTSPSETFPERIKGSRGMWIGQHIGKKLSIVPFFALLPAGNLESFASWWPLLSIGGESYGLVLIPFVIGWEWRARGQSPVGAAKTLGRHTFLLAIVVLALTIGSLFIDVLSLGAVIVSLIGRELILVFHRIREEKQAFFSANSTGIRILGVIPESPAAQMGLVPGELIERVNAVPVRTENQFYEALQNSGAFTKLEVRDELGENRYVQRAMYEGEHYELGLVFVEPATHETSVGFF